MVCEKAAPKAWILKDSDLMRELMKSDLLEIILYGSCDRGDYSEDSDIYIALLTRCDRVEAKK